MAHDRRAELIDVVARVRNRWRLRLALRGVIFVVAGTLLALLLSASSLEALRFSSSAIISFRIVAVSVFAALVAYFLARPLRRRCSDTQVALYLEERDPSLEAAILSAVETSGGDPSHSPRLVERLVEQAIDQCRALDEGRTVDRQALRRYLIALGTVWAVAALIITFGPPYLRHGLSALLVLSRSAEAASPYRIDVRPGNAKVPRGSDQAVTARLIGFASKEAALMMRTSAGAAFERVPLVPGTDATTFEGMLFHLDKQTEYYVESNGVRSPAFSMAVLDLPTVAKLELEYHFPAYTGLGSRKVDIGGDVAALRGTEVSLRVTPTMPAPGGQIRLNDSGAAALTTQADGTLTGSFRIERQGFYKIELTGPHGEKVDASPQYTIDILDDQAPSISFSKPGRDTSASPVEEVFLEARADDDFGVKQLQLAYSVNGGPEKSVTLFAGKPMPEVSAGHTVYLEELGLKPGDFVSYYGRATDNDTVRGPKTATSDIYFVQIRPFRKDYKPAQSMAGMGGGGGGNDVGQLSQQQREIVAATFNVVRDRPKMSADKFRENVVFLNLAQAKLREQVDELVGKLQARLGVVDPNFNKIAEALPKASAEMKAAESDLKTQQAKEALAPEQRALKLLQEAEQEYETQILANRGGGGGGGGSNALADDLADLFELELDKLANQYEMQQRAEQQSGDRQIDELVEKLKELARRQQQEAERQRRMAAQGANASGGSSSQRALAEEAQEAARRLQQLTRDQQRQDLAEAARQMQEAANAMRQAAANGSRDGGAQANAALDKLREAQQRLQRNQSGRSTRDLRGAQRAAEELAAEQKEIASEVNGLDQTAAAQRAAKAQALGQRKDAMDAKVADLQQQLEKLANETRRDERETSRKLDEAAGTIRDKKVREKIRYSKGALQGSPSQYARSMEDDISANLDALQKKVAEAAGALGKTSKEDQLARAADKAKDLVRGMQSLDERTRQRGQNGQGQNGQPPQNGQAGRSGQQNARGQQGQQGQQGSDGQQAQGGQQGQNGQQGGQPGGAFGDRGGPNNGGPWGGYGYGDARSWGWNGGYWWTPEDMRQFRREFREWQTDAEALRRQLAQAGVNPRDLDEILRDLRGLDNDRMFADPKGLEKLQAQALERLQKFEFNLRKKVDPDRETLSLSGSDEVPPGFRDAIAEYYRSLAKKPSK